MADHDQRMKVALPEFLAEYVALAVPAWLGRFDLAAPLWLQQEIFLAPPQGERRVIDLVARVPLTQKIGEGTETLLHFEIESGESLTDLRQRMPRYHNTLLYKHDLPVLSLALYLYVGPEGIGWDESVEQYWEEPIGTTRWRYLGLPKLDGLKYVEEDNLLGVALSVLMRVPEERKAWLKLRALTRIAEAPLTAYRRSLLMEIIEAYLPLHEPHMSEYQRLLLTEEFKMVRELGQTTFERGVEKGEESGRIKTLSRLIEAKFGPLGQAARARLENCSSESLSEIEQRIFSAGSLAELGLEVSTNGTQPASS